MSTAMAASASSFSSTSASFSSSSSSSSPHPGVASASPFPAFPHLRHFDQIPLPSFDGAGSEFDAGVADFGRRTAPLTQLNLGPPSQQDQLQQHQQSQESPTQQRQPMGGPPSNGSSNSGGGFSSTTPPMEPGAGFSSDGVGLDGAHDADFLLTTTQNLGAKSLGSKAALSAVDLVSSLPTAATALCSGAPPPNVSIDAAWMAAAASFATPTPPPPMTPARKVKAGKEREMEGRETPTPASLSSPSCQWTPAPPLILGQEALSSSSPGREAGRLNPAGPGSSPLYPSNPGGSGSSPLYSSGSPPLAPGTQAMLDPFLGSHQPRPHSTGFPHSYSGQDPSVYQRSSLYDGYHHHHHHFPQHSPHPQHPFSTAPVQTYYAQASPGGVAPDDDGALLSAPRSYAYDAGFGAGVRLTTTTASLTPVSSAAPIQSHLYSGALPHPHPIDQNFLAQMNNWTSSLSSLSSSSSSSSSMTSRDQKAPSPHGNEGECENPTKRTRTKDKYRVVYSDHQRVELEKEFILSPYITIKRKAELALSLELSERQVKIWFQNRRAKERKQFKKEGAIGAKDSTPASRVSDGSLSPTPEEEDAVALGVPDLGSKGTESAPGAEPRVAGTGVVDERGVELGVGGVLGNVKSQTNESSYSIDTNFHPPSEDQTFFPPLPPLQQHAQHQEGFAQFQLQHSAPRPEEESPLASLQQHAAVEQGLIQSSLQSRVTEQLLRQRPTIDKQLQHQPPNQKPFDYISAEANSFDAAHYDAACASPLPSSPYFYNNAEGRHFFPSQSQLEKNSALESATMTTTMMTTTMMTTRTDKAEEDSSTIR